MNPRGSSTVRDIYNWCGYGYQGIQYTRSEDCKNPTDDCCRLPTILASVNQTLPYYRKLTLVFIDILEINATQINANQR